MKIRAVMGRRRAPLCPAEYQVDKVADIPNTQFKEHNALLNARVAEISPGPEGTEVVLTDVDPQELARFNQAYEDHQAAEQAMGPAMG